jgi:hypothetical protein
VRQLDVQCRTDPDPAVLVEDLDRQAAGMLPGDIGSPAKSPEPREAARLTPGFDRMKTITDMPSKFLPG